MMVLVTAIPFHNIYFFSPPAEALKYKYHSHFSLSIKVLALLEYLNPN